jgi:hypothetical protein
MDTAALVISIFAVLLSLIVAGFAIGLQWRMFNATSQQLNLIGKENASLGERIATSLGQLHETATTTRRRLDTALDQLVSGLLGRVAPSAEAPAGVAGESRGDLDAWVVERGARLLQRFRAAPALLEYLGGGAPTNADTAVQQLLQLRPEDRDEGDWEMDLGAVITVLEALDVVRVDPEKDEVSLTAQGRQIAARLSEGGHD